MAFDSVSLRPARQCDPDYSLAVANLFAESRERETQAARDLTLSIVCSRLNGNPVPSTWKKSSNHGETYRISRNSRSSTEVKRLRPKMLGR
jgi:hypothetical protein